MIFTLLSAEGLSPRLTANTQQHLTQGQKKLVTLCKNVAATPHKWY